jgi:RNA-binding protein 39
MEKAGNFGEFLETRKKMTDVFDVEAILDQQVDKTKVNSDEGVEKIKEALSSSEKREENDNSRRDSYERERRRSGEKEREKDRTRDRSRERRHRSRSPRDRERDRRRRSGSNSDRNRSRRERSRDRYRSSRRDRSADRNSRSRSPRRSSRDEEKDRSREREGKRSPSNNEDKPVELSIPKVDVEAITKERDALKRKKEIEELTKDQRTIFVGQLTKKVQERDLERFFGQIGKVKSVIMLRDKFTGAHKGFAYVEMEDLEHVPNALLFNNVVPDFQKFPILVKASEAEKNFLARKDPFTKQLEGPDTRIYIGNIHLSLDENALKAVLEQFGPVESVKLHRDHLGNSKGFAFVKFIRPDSSAIALAALPGLEIAGRALKVGHVSESKTGSTDASGNLNSSFANDGSVNWRLDAEDGGGGLQLNAQSRMQLMAKLAQTAGMTIPIPTLQPPVNSSSVSAATAAAKMVPPVSGIPSRYILIANMFDPATETEPNWDHEIKEDVKEECDSLGGAEQVVVETKKPGGIVFVRMRTIDGATKAANSLNGRYFAGRMITCSFLDEKTYNDMTK